VILCGQAWGYKEADVRRLRRDFVLGVLAYPRDPEKGTPLFPDEGGKGWVEGRLARHGLPAWRAAERAAKAPSPLSPEKHGRPDRPGRR
jgi:hypothetical protein